MTKKQRERIHSSLGSLCKEQLLPDSWHSGQGLWVSLAALLPFRVCCVLQQETSCSDLSCCLVRSKNTLIQKSCSVLNNFTAPIPDCILNLAGGWGQGSCCPCTWSWCQAGPWHFPSPGRSCAQGEGSIISEIPLL